MALPEDYLNYPHRRYGMDHDRYDWSILPERAPVTWPGGARVALWVTVTSEFFPINERGKPFKAPGGMVTAYPDYRHYTSRDYGNRVGIFRLMKVMSDLGIPASCAMNAAVARRYPYLVRRVMKSGWELMGHGLDMDHLHHGELDEAEERALIQESLKILRDISGQPVNGWLSPARSQSARTPDLLAAEGIDYMGDWANDDMPYAFRTANGPILNMPCAHEISDRQVFINYHHTEKDFYEQIKDQFDYLYKESATQGGRIMSLMLTPYISGLPFRIKTVEAALNYILGHKDVWVANGADIAAAFAAQTAAAE